MRNRWGILAILFLVRLAMPLQFQSVGAVAPLLGSSFGMSLADIGLLIGLYFTPGVALALAGGGLGQRFGDKQTVVAGLIVMVVGELAMASSPTWTLQVGGRLVSGAGGVLLTVQMTKMVTDWFAGREIATAMAIFINAWPVGLGLSLLILPAIGTTFGVATVYVAVAALIGTALPLLLIGYRSPETASHAAGKAERLDRRTTLALIVAGLIWGSYNIGPATIFSFGPALLVERGWSIAAAGSTISIVLWVSVPFVPLAGYLADRLKRPEAIFIGGGCLVFAALVAALAHANAVPFIIIALGVTIGLPAGSIMSLPPRVLAPATRAIGMGIFFTIYYVAMMLGPVIGGAFAKWAGGAAAAFDFAAVALIASPLLLWVFNRMTLQKEKLA
ncbi:MAG TPA: MFS transporter [Bradyrhizobium sp.]|nr:MFS transporter [Bradyrhizobium sp.]